ncbi:MAG: hypothetical protein RLZZ581_49 [Actinomycetota bacterium]|jgi:hypothetical protein
MNRKRVIVPLVLATIVSIAYFSAGPRVPMDNDSTSDLALAEKAKEEEVNEVEGGFGSDITLANGAVVNISDPTEWKPKDAAALGFEGRPQILTVKFTNNGSADFDISYFAIIESTFASDLSSACVDVFELDSGVKGLPDDPVVKAGQSVEFQWAIVCPAPKDDELTLTFSLSESDVVTLKSTVK